MKRDVRRWRRWVGRFRLWSRRVGLGRMMAYALAAAAVASGLATVATMTGSSLLGPDPKTVLLLLYLDAVLLLLLAVVVARRLASVWAERRRGLAGSGLHVRLVLLFSVVLSYTLNHQEWVPSPDHPYVIAIVEIEEQAGLRLMTNIVHCEPDAVSIGMPVRVVFEQHDDVHIPLFEPAAG